VTDLQSELNDLDTMKANAAHTHTISEVISLQYTLDSKADIAHTHSAEFALIPTVNQSNAMNNAYPAPTATNAFVTVDYLEQNGAAPTVQSNGGSFTSGSFNTTHYPYEIQITIAGTTYAMPARII